MADKIATLERERSIRTLVERLFVLEGRDAAAKRSHAEKALLRANPELSSADGFRLGRRIVIPGDIGLELKEQPEPVAEEAKGIFDETDARAAFRTLHEALAEVARLVAPVTPFLADWLHRSLTGHSVAAEEDAS